MSVNVLFMDGSGHTIGNAIDLSIWRALGGRRTGSRSASTSSKRRRQLSGHREADY